MGRLRDVAPAAPRILFVGINPSLRSAAAGHHFAGPGNPFWRLLYAAKLVPVPLSWEEDRRFAEYGMALTNVCPRATRSAADLRRDEVARGLRALEQKVRRLKPQMVALVGVTIYRALFPREKGAGPGEKSQTLGGARLFVLPNPSGRNALFPGFGAKLVWYERLRESVAVGRAGPEPHR